MRNQLLLLLLQLAGAVGAGWWLEGHGLSLAVGPSPPSTLATCPSPTANHYLPEPTGAQTAGPR